MAGTTPRVVFDAYGHEYQFRSGLIPKYTFNLTGTVTPVVICRQNHKQVRHMFAVCPPGSRYLFECDSQFGLESWVEVSVCLRSGSIMYYLNFGEIFVRDYLWMANFRLWNPKIHLYGPSTVFEKSRQRLSKP